MEYITLCLLAVDIFILIISVVCLSDVLKAKKEIESDLKAIRLLHRALELKDIERKSREEDYNRKILGKWEGLDND